ncbi:MAG: T6SS effector BTH_I2691 family protein, partial [Telluria sp.]
MSNCELCERKGVLIFPVRYAIACPGGAMHAPGLAGNFKIDGAPREVGKAKYTLRSMRQGYLYAFDEKRKSLRAYVVTAKGQLWNFNSDFLPPPPETIKFGCTNQAEVAYSRCIDITHQASNAATHLWIGWSSVVWTKAMIARVHDGAWRKKHMQCIDVAAMLAGSAPHTGEFDQYHAKIAHFGMDKEALERAFSFSNTPIVQEQSQSKLHKLIGLTMARHGPYNKGYIVGLNDPVGITHDLSELTTPSVDAGFNEDIARGKMVYELLQSTEAGLREEAVQGVAKADAVAKYYAAHPDKGGDLYNETRKWWHVLTAGGHDAYAARIAADKKKYGTDLAARQRAAAEHAWRDVTFDGSTPKLDQARINNFPALYASTLKEFEPEYENIARSHHAWLTSEQLANWMDGVHDPADLRSGYAYSESVLQCIGAGINTGMCSTQLMTWLNSGNLSGNRNLYGRGLLF